MTHQRPLRLCGPARTECTDVTDTFAAEDWNGSAWVGGHWYSGGIDVNPQAGHTGNGYYWHSLANPWSGYAFTGTWVEGQPLTVGFWSRVDAAPCTFHLGSAGAGSSSPMNADSVSLIVSDADADWTYREMTWTPANTIVSDGAQNHAGVKLHMSYGASSSTGIAFDGDAIKACFLVDVLNGTSALASRCDHQHHWLSTSEPTADDDTTLGFRVGTIWHQVDDVDAPTEILAEWVLVDASDGAAVWLEWPSGSLTVEEVDGSPTDSAVTKLVFPNGTLGITSHVATYTPLGPMINTDADPGTKIYVGLTDPDGMYTLAEGDVWIDRNP